MQTTCEDRIESTQAGSLRLRVLPDQPFFEDDQGFVDFGGWAEEAITRIGSPVIAVAACDGVGSSFDHSNEEISSRRSVCLKRAAGKRTPRQFALLIRRGESHIDAQADGG